jgi:lipoyl(octanoyl) transferase
MDDRPLDELWVCHLGVVPYRDALALQHEVRAARQADAIPDVLLLLEHPPTYTRGKRSQPGELGRGEQWYRDQGIDIVDVRRGGKLTYHGPGQLVGYPIVRTRGALEHVRTMERALVSALQDEGIDARSRPDESVEFTGVWVGDAKIASVGVHVQRGVTMHGFALNASNDLEPFSWAVACGLPDVEMVSVASVTGRSDDVVRCLRKRVAWRYAIASGRRQRLVSEARLRAALDAAAIGGDTQSDVAPLRSPTPA